MNVADSVVTAIVVTIFELSVHRSKMEEKDRTSDECISALYQKMTQREHVYRLPDTYCGSTENAVNSVYMLNPSKTRMQKKEVDYPPALYKIVDELVVNTYDQFVRLNKTATKFPVTKIDVSVDPATTEFVITNNGEGIDIAMHPEHGIYTVELIFGNLLTSTNYKEDEERLTGGKNGLGSKICNIFSHKFTVTTVDFRRKLMYKQTFRDNMLVAEKPEIIEGYMDPPFTSIAMVPDLNRFSLKEWTPTMLRIIEKRAYELSACTPGVTVSFNGTAIKIRNFEKFLDFFEEFNASKDDSAATTVSTSAPSAPPSVPSKSSSKEKVYERVNERWEVGVALSDGFQQVSFVNGLNTIRGGKHVDYVTNSIVRTVCDYIDKKKKIRVKAAVVRENLFVAVNCQIVNPSFDSQTKDTLTTSVQKFGSKCELSEKFLKRIFELGLVERVIALHEFKENRQLQKTEGGKKKARIYDIPKLEDANEAGGARSAECTLILTEGDSAKATAVAGFSVVGRDLYGVFPLKGKMINSRDKCTTVAGRDALSKNEELINIKRILGLETGKMYTSISDLRYGRVMIMTDQDVDGSHIKGLFINWIESNWPELIKLGFVTCLLTPIIKASKGKVVESFYSINSFNEWYASATGSWKIKYYKGLGTSTSIEAKEYFRDLKTMKFCWSEDAHDRVDMLFNKTRANDRKDWILTTYDASKIMDCSISDLTLDRFVNEEMIFYSIYDNKRSIGHLMDGMKPSQRKILFSCFKKGLRDEIKVAQLTGYVSEHSGYHHGEESLNKTIVAMAQNFVGANNVELLRPNGQFGSRLEGGKDSASPRYIFTSLDPLTEALFPTADRPLLKYLEDDGQMIEPTFYAPILPLVLINGMRGIGTGWSTYIPNFNPLEISLQFKERLSGTRSSFSNMTPWYSSFQGQIVSLSENAFMTKGVYCVSAHNKVVITELPIEMWTNDYKSFLDSLLLSYETTSGGGGSGGGGASSTASTTSKKKSSAILENVGFLKSYKTNCTESLVNFELEVDPEILSRLCKNLETEDAHVNSLEKILRLTSKISLTNMHLFDKNDLIRKYSNVSDIMEEFFHSRLEFYSQRKSHQLQDLRGELAVLSAKVRFVQGIVDDTIPIVKRTSEQLNQDLESLGFPMFSSAKGAQSDSKASYSYLLNMPVQSLSVDTLEALKKQLQSKEEMIVELEAKNIEKIWFEEIVSFEESYRSSLSKKLEAVEIEKSEMEKNFTSKAKKPRAKSAASSSATGKTATSK